MPREFKRVVRVAESIKRVVAPLLNDWVREHQLGMASVTNVVVSSDMRQSKIYVSLYGCDDARAVVKSINEDRHQFRQSIGRELSLRNVPEIKFLQDDSIRSSDNISRMLDGLNDRDDNA
ncbi:MAG: 30S ribosome-binding factor RbfA [Proteobacteria bacterium]|nr:30S ribosome-binding factor RbfA [Pseudomonadota bacterium]